jgi:hypothetical protein
MKTYKCYDCEFVGDYGELITHRQHEHSNAPKSSVAGSEIHVLKCRKCSFQTISKNYNSAESLLTEHERAVHNGN